MAEKDIMRGIILKRKVYWDLGRLLAGPRQDGGGNEAGNRKVLAREAGHHRQNIG